MWVCVGIYVLLNYKKEWNNTICSNMGGPRDYHTKWSKTEKDKYYVISLICGTWKKVQMNFQNRNRPTDIENKHVYQREKWGRDKLRGWD